MSTPQAPPVTAFRCQRLNDDGTRTQVGGSYDNISAVGIANAAYIVAQGYSPDTGLTIEVVDDTGTVIAYVGQYPAVAAPHEGS